MRLTNELHLPDPLVAAITNDTYDRTGADFTTTELINAPRIEALRRKHEDDIPEDASDRIFSLLGQVAHGIIERAASDRYVSEKRYFIEREGYRIGGQIDLYDKQTCELSDWKVTSLWSGKDGAKNEWMAQGNINALLMEENGVQVKSVAFYGIYRDWSKMRAGFAKDYPQHQVQRFPIPRWPKAQTEQFIAERIRLHLAARETLPDCTAEERWERPERWAVMKKGAKRALKLHDTELEASQHAALAGARVEHRPGESVRCLHYCPVLAFCSFGRELVREASGD